MNKISTSIQYQLTNIKLPNDVFANFEDFDELLKSGPDSIKLYLLNQWNAIKDIMSYREDIEMKDIDKEISIDDFEVTFNKTKNGSPIFFITFPDYEYNDGASKYVAIAITRQGVKYYTYEYSQKITGGTNFVIGEFYIKDGKFAHNNYGTSEDERMSWFAGFITSFLETQNL